MFCGAHKKGAVAVRCGKTSRLSDLGALCAEHRDTHEAGIVEADESFCLQSFNEQRELPRAGVGKARTAELDPIAVLVVRDRVSHSADFQLAKRRKRSMRTTQAAARVASKCLTLWPLIQPPSAKTSRSRRSATNAVA